MGSLIYDFLNESFLFSEKLIETNFSTIAEPRIYEELQRYRKYCIENYDKVNSEIVSNNSALKVFSNSQPLDIKLLTQTGLYIDQYIISDPLFKLTQPNNNAFDAMKEFQGFQTGNITDKNILTQVIRYLKLITPCIVYDYVKLMPYNIHFEPPKELPMYYPIDGYKNVLPPQILKYFRNNAIVQKLEKSERGFIVNNSLETSRKIIISFKKYLQNPVMIYSLDTIQGENYDEKSKIAKIRFIKSDSPPNKEQFDIWVNQSINSTAKALFDKTYKENLIAAETNSTYLCDNTFISKLLGQNIENNESTETYTANELINLDLPFIDNINLSKLMEIRVNDSDVFNNFRFELEKKINLLRLANDSYETDRIKEEIIRELYTVQFSKINQGVRKASRKLTFQSLELLGSLLFSSITNGLTLISAAQTAFRGFSTYKEFQDKVKQNPSYLLWKTVDKKSH